MKDDKKILTFINGMNCGGAQRVMSYLMNSWAEKGYEVVLVTISGKPSFYALHREIEWISLCDASTAKNTVSAVIVTAQRILRLRKLLKKNRPVSALSFMPSANVQLSLASIGLPHKVVGSERVYPPFAGLTPLWTLARFFSYRFLDSLIVQTKDASDWMKRNVKTKNVAIIPNPVTVSQNFDKNIKIVENQKHEYTILAVGRLVPQKGFDILIAAFARLAVKYPKWQLCIAGEGPQRDYLEKMILNYGLKDKIILLGEVSNIEFWYQNASLFVMSSRFEGFPNALAEAMAYGLPVISFDCKTGPRELIKHEINGLLVEPENEDDLVYSLNQLMNDRDMREKLSTAALEIRDLFSLEKIENQYLEILNIV